MPHRQCKKKVKASKCNAKMAVLFPSPSILFLIHSLIHPIHSHLMSAKNTQSPNEDNKKKSQAKPSHICKFPFIPKVIPIEGGRVGMGRGRGHSQM
jgi:hypothetical protein